jgi:glycerol-1-phosphate dehydrogenase [NAD(P)+]
MLFQKEFHINDYLNKHFSCSCHRDHFVPIKHILLQEDALARLTVLLSEGGFSKPFFLFDQTTYSIAGASVKDIIEAASLPFYSYVFPEAEPVPNEEALGKILIHYPVECDVIIAVGSGTMNDLGRFLSFKLGLPYLIIATAPSMDGFASNVSPLIAAQMKATYEAQIPYAILGDLSILKNAPMKMIAAGIGDILGKYTCLCDWRIAHELNGEYLCAEIEQLVRHSIATVISGVSKLKDRDASAINSIMEALILSGIAMSFAGNSRPASGSEHHLSHYWEMMFLFEGKKPVLHGTKVGVSTIAVIKAYELLMAKKIDFKKAKELAVTYQQQQWEASMRELYLDAAPSVIALEQAIGKNRPEHVLPRLEKLEANWNKVKEIAGSLPSADSIKDILLSLDAPADPMAVGIDKTTFMNSFVAAKELRDRFGLLQILFDLRLTEEIAEETWNYFYE